MKIFVVEDDSWYAQFLKHHLSKNVDFNIEIIKDGKTLLSKLSEKPDLITLDYNLPDIEGVDLLNKILTFNSNLNVIVVSEQKDIKIATKLIKIGAFDYIVKDDDSAINIWNSCLKVAKLSSLENKVVELKKQLKNNSKKSKIIGSCPQLENVFSLINKASKVNIPVSVLGETGTGKELVAKEIFDNYSSSKNDLVTVNISSLNPNLIESELFGHEPGAFTGAIHKHVGYFEQANDSVLFLDEIAELPLNIQSKLLRVIQEKIIRRVGGNKDIKIDFKLITATHKDLRKEVKNGNFREDLYFRVKGMTIELPPLRERGSDIILLAEHFVKHFVLENQLSKISINNSAKKKLLDYSFPGNVRELKSIIDLACVLCDSEINDEHIQLESITDLQLLDKERTLREYEYLIIVHFLAKYNNNVVEVAKLLGIGKSTIYRLIKEGNLNKVQL